MSKLLAVQFWALEKYPKYVRNLNQQGQETMRNQFVWFFAFLSMSTAISFYSTALSQEPAVDGGNGAANQEGVEVLARGPVHEAFAEPSVRSPRPTPIVPKQPPDPIEEMPPDQKPEGSNVIWIPGYWIWDEERNDFIWESGIWRDVPPDHHWVPGYWNQVDDGWQWVSGYWNIQAQETVDYLPAPPNPVAESVPAAPDAQSTFVPGTWVFYQTRYVWRPGFWIRNRPGWIWTPAYYRWTPAGYVFVDGYWDYPFADRGLLFAPVFIDRTFWTRPRWYFRPNYVIRDTFLLGSLFVRLDYSRYYFGDYYDASYSRHGFVPWVDFRFGRIPDPLFSYYRWHFANVPNWEANMRQLYVTRQQNPLARPPRTFAQASAAPATAAVKAGTFASIQTATPLTPLTKVSANTGIKLQTVPQAQLTQIREAAVATHNSGRERGQAEAKAFSQGQSAAKAGQPFKVELPKTSRPAVVQTPGATPKPPPPPPNLPKVETRNIPKTTPPSNYAPRPVPGLQDRPKAEPKSERKTEPKAEPKQTPPKVEPKPPAPRPEPKVEPKAEPKPAPPPRPEPKVEPKSAPRPEPKPEPKPAPKEEKDKNKKEKDK
jgi:hypothetical protein